LLISYHQETNKLGQRWSKNLEINGASKLLVRCNNRDFWRNISIKSKWHFVESSYTYTNICKCV